VSAPASFRNKPIDRRRLSMQDRSSYKPQQRLGAIAKAKAYKSQLSRSQKQKQFATEQKPGTGGFTQGLSRQQQRMREVGQEQRRAESFRPEDAVSSDIYDKLST
jgi:hypothetical protein